MTSRDAYLSVLVPCTIIYLQLTSPQLATCTVQGALRAGNHAWCTLLHVGTVAAVVVSRVDEVWYFNACVEVCVVWPWCMELQQLFLLTAG